jgi:opacity protein-like surface antigen
VYTGGFAIGYTRLVCHRYLLGPELSGNYDSHTASYQAGAASAAFSDLVNVDNHFYLTFVPGVLLNNTTAAFLKIGVSRASLRDSLISSVGFTPEMTPYNSNNNVNGFVAGLKLEKFLLDRVTVFVEGDYRDYGMVNFSRFQNFTATYTNFSHVYTYDALLDVAYHS